MSQDKDKKELKSENQEEEVTAEQSDSSLLEEMPFLSHLDEMRRRIIRSVVAAFLGMLALVGLFVGTWVMRSSKP